MKRSGLGFSLKRWIAVALTIVMLFCLSSDLKLGNDAFEFAAPFTAAAYSNGNYKVSTSSGVNVRGGPGTSYSKKGAATNGTSFTVTDINGSWGKTSSIKCTNGYQSGWVCLSYCTYISSGGGGSGGNGKTGNGVVYNCSYLNVRTEPSSSGGD